MISKQHRNLNWENIFQRFKEISEGLRHIHEKGYYHKDFHSGNILNWVSDTWNKSMISDFGMSRPADDRDEKSLYGVIPFIAPEVLRGKEFTKAADIYGFGMIMWEILSGEPPFIDREYDQSLIIDICMKDLRPPIPKYAPEPYVTLMKGCWNPIPTNRPTAGQINHYWELYNKLDNDYRHVSDDEDYDYDRVYCDYESFSKEREDQWKERLAERARNPRPLKESHNFFTSKRLDGM